jgi:hypothetical protein
MATQKIELMGGKWNDVPYIFETPSVPTDEKKIYNFDKKRKDQIWSIPDDIKRFREMSVGEKKLFVEQERERWINGFWLFIDGEPTYITGMHYDHLVYQTFEFGKADYLDSQRHDFYFRDYCRRDKYSYGELWMKPRRYGMTAEEITENQYIALSAENMQVGLVSNENKKTIDSIFRPIVDSYIKRPKYIRARIYMPNGKKPRKEMLFQGNVIKNYDSDDLYMDTNGDLNGWIIPKATTVTAFDAMKLHKLTADEVWKWIICNPEEFWGAHKKCLEDGGRIIGKASFLSTMGDSDDYADAIEAGVRMWHGSDPSERDANGRTKTGLYRYFIDAIYSLREFKNEFGKINIDQAETFLENEFAKLDPNSKEYVFEKRRMPRKPDDALMGADVSKIFDNPRIPKRLEIIKKLSPADKPYVFGNCNELNNGRVEWEPTPKGIWKMATLPMMDAVRKIDASNRYKKIGELFFKPVNPEGCGGYDSINFADVDTTSGNKSRAAAIFRQKFDYYGNGGANRYVSLMVQRPDEPDDAHYEVIKMCRFLGYPVMIDRAALTGIKKKFKEHGMGDFLMKNPKDGIMGMWADNQKRFTKDGVNKVYGYFKNPQSEHDFDAIEEQPFEELFEDMIPFKIHKTTKFDVAMADILLEYGMEQIIETSLRDSAASGIYKNNPLFGKRN